VDFRGFGCSALAMIFVLISKGHHHPSTDPNGVGSGASPPHAAVSPPVSGPRAMQHGSIPRGLGVQFETIHPHRQRRAESLHGIL